MTKVKITRNDKGGVDLDLDGMQISDIVSNYSIVHKAGSNPILVLDIPLNKVEVFID